MKRLLLQSAYLVVFILSLHFAPQAQAVHPVIEADGFTDIIGRSKPAIVYIQVTTRVSSRGSSAHDKILKDLFGESAVKENDEPFLSTNTGYSFGSGFIINPDGYILTNYHVLKDATAVTVTTADKQKLKGTIIGTDPKTDIGLLKIDGKDFPAIQLGDSDTIKTGQWVLAFGSPYEFIQSVTAGIISATGRHTLGISDYEDYIQTDAAINPGNSGGPLVNTSGEAIGINTAFLTQTGGYMGIGFAIPINIARTISEQLLEKGNVTRAWLGIAMEDAASDQLSAQNLPPATQAATILEVKKGSPAEGAGLQEGDMIVTISGIPIRGAADLRNRVALSAPDEEVTLEFYRNGQKQSVRVLLARLK